MHRLFFFSFFDWYRRWYWKQPHIPWIDDQWVLSKCLGNLSKIYHWNVGRHTNWWSIKITSMLELWEYDKSMGYFQTRTKIRLEQRWAFLHFFSFHKYRSGLFTHTFQYTLKLITCLLLILWSLPRRWSALHKSCRENKLDYKNNMQEQEYMRFLKPQYVKPIVWIISTNYSWWAKRRVHKLPVPVQQNHCQKWERACSGTPSCQHNITVLKWSGLTYTWTIAYNDGLQ